MRDQHVPLATQAGVPRGLVNFLLQSRVPLMKNPEEWNPVWQEFWPLIKYTEWFYFTHVKDFPNAVEKDEFASLSTEQRMEMGATLSFYTMVKLTLSLYELSPRARL